MAEAYLCSTSRPGRTRLGMRMVTIIPNSGSAVGLARASITPARPTTRGGGFGGEMPPQPSLVGHHDALLRRATISRHRRSGYLPLQTEAAVLFQVITQRYLKSSIVMTTNLGVGSWGKIFDDSMVGAAALDHLLHRSVVFNIEGESYRKRSHCARTEDPNGGPRSRSKTKNLHRSVNWGISLVAPDESRKPAALAAVPRQSGFARAEQAITNQTPMIHHAIRSLNSVTLCTEVFNHKSSEYASPVHSK